MDRATPPLVAAIAGIAALALSAVLIKRRATARRAEVAFTYALMWSSLVGAVVFSIALFGAMSRPLGARDAGERCLEQLVLIDSADGRPMILPRSGFYECALATTRPAVGTGVRAGLHVAVAAGALLVGRRHLQRSAYA